MNVLMLVFSPAGSTLSVAKRLEQRLVDKGCGVQLLNVTGNREMFREGRIQEVLETEVRPHDLILIGAPVYEKHLEFYAMELLKHLPKAGGKWGAHAIPFVTYGGVSSGRALKESVALLKKSGRTPIAAMKLEASHIVTKKLQKKVNEGMPGQEADGILEELVERVVMFRNGGGNQSVMDFSGELDYHGTKEKILCTIMKEKLLHKYKYPPFTILEGKCTKCLKCVKSCPCQRITEEKGKPAMLGNKPECIHCFSCVNSCEVEAVTFVNGEKDWSEIERIYNLVSAPGSLFQSNEQPRSAVYPIRKR